MPSSSIQNQSYSAESNLFVFYIDKFSSQSGNYSFVDSESYQESGAVVKTQVNQQSPIAVAPSVFLSQSNIETVDDTRDANGTWHYNQYSYQEVINPCLIGAGEGNYVYHKHTKTEKIQVAIETTHDYKLHWHYGDDYISTNWEKIDLVAPDFGATLRGSSFYCVTPSLNVSAQGSNLYGVEDRKFWKKSKSDYRNLANTYDNPAPEKGLSNILVWAAQITETGNIEIKEDIVVSKVYPLLEGAVVLAASYHP